MICLRLPGAGIFTDYLLLEVIQRRIGANTIRRQIQDQVNLRKKIREKDKIRRIGVIRELFERVRTEPKVKEHISWVLSSRQLSLIFLIPETSSRDL